MSVKRAFFSIFQKIVVICCAIFFGFANAFSANLPSGYTELQYIKSTGTQWIDTGLTVKSNTLADFDYQYTNCDSTNYVFGQVSGTGTSIMGYRTTRIWWFKANNLSNACDLNKHTVSFASDGKVYQDGQVLATRGSFYEVQSATMKLFAELNDDNVINKGRVKIYNFTFKEGSTIVRNFVPAKNSSGVIGMYDTVNNRFYTNQGSGTFTAGPAKCRNLFDANTVVNINRYIHNNDGTPTAPSSSASSWRYSDYIEVEPSTTYKISGIIFASAETAGMAWYNQSKEYITGMSSSAMNNANGVITSPNNAKYLRFSWHATSNPNWADTLQLESGSTATTYVPFCAPEIKIATTAYNAARFSPVQTDLNNAVATIREIVTKTINQTAAIASLQADKQTRPEDACPAGKKCLLVETEENGVIVPHWFPIIEAPTD